MFKTLIFFIAVLFIACEGPTKNIGFPLEEKEFLIPKAIHFNFPLPVKTSWHPSNKILKKPRINKVSFVPFKESVFDIEPLHNLNVPIDSSLIKIDELPYVSLAMKTLPRKKIKPEIIVLGKPVKVKAGFSVVESKFTKGIMEFGQDQGLSGTTVMGLAQDKNGRLWLGTDNGLCVYNGEFIYTWFKRNGISYDSKFSLFEDSKGHIWAVGKGVDEIIPEEGIVRHFGKRQGLSSNAVTNVMQDSKGRICISSRTGLDIYDPLDETLIHIGKNEGLSIDNINKTIEDREGRLWLATNCGGVNIYDPAKEKLYILSDKQNLSNNDIRAIIEDKHGNIWMGGWNGGVDMFDHKRGIFYHIKEKHGLSFSYIHALMEDHNGIIWIGCLDGGLDYYDPALRKICHVYGAQGILKSSVLCLLEDKDNCIWFGCDGAGVLKYDPSNGDINNFDPAWRSAKSALHSFFIDKEGKYWLSSSGQGIDIFDEKEHSLKNFKMGEDWTNAWTNQIIEDKKGNIFLCSDSRFSIYDKKNKIITSWGEDEGLIHNGIKAIVLSNDDVMIGSKGGIEKYDISTSNFMYLDAPADPVKSNVSCMTLDNKGKIWIGTFNAGLIVYDTKTSALYHFTKSRGFSNNIIYSITIDKENCIWVATGGDGLKKIDLHNSTITTITTEEGLAEMTVTSVITLENKVYAGTAKGLSVIELKNKNLSVQNYDKLQGFRTRDFNSNAVLLSANKSIWWGIGDMLTIYKPADKKFLPHQTNFTGIDVMGKELEFNSVQNFINKLNVTDTIWTSARDTFYFKNSLRLDTSFKSNNNIVWNYTTGPYNMPKELQLPYNQNHITFHFTGNQLSNPDKTKYRYILEGTEKKWNPIVTVAFADYRNLSPGKYIFKVSSNNFGGPWSEPVEMSLTIAPPWWKTKLAYIFYIILLLGSIFTYNRINTERLRKRQKELEAVVDERTKEVVKQKNEIEIQKQTVEEKQKEIVDSINYAKRIQYTLLAHEKVLKKHFSDHFVLFQPKDIVSGDFYWATKKIINAGLNFNANEETTVQVQNAKTELFYLAVCDSTGHGVPGAFMSLLNISFINEAINERNIFSPDEILNYVRQRLIKSVSREGGQDGMDGILLCFESPIKEQETDNAINENQKKIKLTYAAGNNSPLLFNNGTLSELPANKMPIGKGEKTEAFTLYTIDATKGDIIYLTTDGFADQFGGPKGKKFKTKKLTALLQDHAHETMDKQHEIILNVLKNWKGDLEQIDDICLLGIKL